MTSDEDLRRPPWMPSPEDHSGPPRWDQEEADWLVGKYALVGITWLAADGKTVKAKRQYHGRIVAADVKSGVKIECEGASAGHTMVLPPDPRSFQPARPGEYKLRSTGELIDDPDVLATWSITEPLKS